MSPAARHDPLTGTVCAILALLLSACASTDKPTVIHASLQVQSDVNPDATGRPSPVVVHLYELKSLAGFNSADFFSLFDHGQETLAGDLVASDELRLMPGEQRRYKRALQMETQFVGVVAAFRDIEHAEWRAAAGVRAHKISPVTIQLDGNRIRISTE